MDELDVINKRLLATLNKRDSEEGEDFDVEREEPSEEQKFKPINDTELSIVAEVSEPNTNTIAKQMSFSKEDGTNMNEPEEMNSDLMTTMKTDKQRATMTQEMKQIKPPGTDVFNPFKSKAEEEEGQSNSSPRSEDNSINRD